MKKYILLFAAAIALSGCASTGMNDSAITSANPYVLISQGGSNFRVWDDPRSSRAFIEEWSGAFALTKGFIDGLSLGLLDTAASRETHLSVLFKYFRTVNKQGCEVLSVERDHDGIEFMFGGTNGYVVQYKCR